jgi:hypothetical protein
MPNTNCLAGWRCPECGQEDAFKVTITARAVVVVTDDGFSLDEAESTETSWEGEDWAQCQGCLHEGTVSTFQVE